MAGDTISGLKWTRKTTAKIAAQLNRLRIRVSPRTVARLLHKLRFSLRVNRKKVGPRHTERRATTNGFEYAALDAAGSLIASLGTTYSQQLRERGAWVISNFAAQDLNSLNAFFNEHIGRWGEEFMLISPGWEDVS